MKTQGKTYSRRRQISAGLIVLLVVALCQGAVPPFRHRLATIALLSLWGKDGYGTGKRATVSEIKGALNCGADVNAQYSSGASVLWAASVEGNTDCVSYLIANGAMVNPKSHDWMPLSAAAYFGKISCVKLLILKGADVNATDKGGNTALMQAAVYSNADCAACLLDHGANVNAKAKNGATALLNAAHWLGKVDCVRVLLKHGADPNAQTFNGQTALMEEAYYSNVGGINLLLSNGANVNETDIDGETALDNARMEHSVPCINLLVAKGADVNVYEGASLYDAAERGDIATVKFVLINRGSINLKNRHGYTALMLAAESGHADCVSYLIANGANVKIVGNHHNTALSMAKGQSGVVTILRAAGA